MAQIVGRYTHVRSENLDDYFKAIGVPYIPRKMMSISNPTIEIKHLENEDLWTITVTTLLRTIVHKFKLEEPYEETMPGAVLKSTTILKDNKLITASRACGDTQVDTSRTYEFSDDGMTITYKHENSGQTSIRHFRREQ